MTEIAEGPLPVSTASRRVLTGTSAAEGFGVGRALRLGRNGAASDATARRSLIEAIVQVRRDLAELLVSLPAAEAELFAPEAHILDEIEPQLLERERGGDSPEEIIFASTNCGCTDLVIDLRERLLGALQGAHGESAHGAVGHHGGDLVLLADSVTPSLVAFLPRQVVALVAAVDGPMTARRDVGPSSHAALLARGRGLPIAYVTGADFSSLAAGAWVIVDATEPAASLIVDPSQRELEAAQGRMETAVNERQRGTCVPLEHLGIALRVNVGSGHDEIPTCADGVGLVRTEMTFAGSAAPPSEDEQLAALMRIAIRARGAPIVVRLFDAGGDKPIAWLGGGGGGTSRGIARLLEHPEVLMTQLRALARARQRADVRVLLPFVESAAELRAVRAIADATLPVGAMIESPHGVHAIAEISAAADFVSIGTNDLTAEVLALRRTDGMPLLEPRVLALVQRTIAGAHAAGRKVTICGELAADERGARIATGLGADVLSVAPVHVSRVRALLAAATMQSCLDEAGAALLGS
jgi:phosphoenolpyruvate-protein kinase (PTS system EI component)